jgi:hypothetical protein
MKGDRAGFERLGYLGSTRFRHVRMVLMMLFAVSVLVVTGNGAFAENLQFDIPAQQLDAALDAFGAISHLQVLYESALTAGRISTAISGNAKMPKYRGLKLGYAAVLLSCSTVFTPGASLVLRGDYGLPCFKRGCL